MNENLKKVFEELQENEEFKKQLKENPPKTEKDLATLLEKLGVDVDLEDLKCSKKELTDEELEKVSGGNDEFLEDCGFWGGFVCGMGMGIGFWD